MAFPRTQAILTNSPLATFPRTVRGCFKSYKAIQGFTPLPTYERTYSTRGRRFVCSADLEKNAETLKDQSTEDSAKVISSNGDSGTDGATTKTQDRLKRAKEYPTEEESQEPNFFPVRDPGDFPSIDIDNVASLEQVEEEEFDPLRDGILRYLGYANELGEAFAAWLPPGGVPLSYAVAVGYVLVDTGDKGLKAQKGAKLELDALPKLDPNVAKEKLTNLLAGERAIDTIVWQLLASVIIPGYTIHTVVAFVHFLLLSGLHVKDPNLLLPAISNAFNTIATTTGTSPDTVAELVDKSVPTFCGLAAIPFIVHPIDATVHALLNVSMRPALRQFLCNNGQGKLAGLAICDEDCIVNDFPVLDESNNVIEAFAKSFEEELE
eukprot:g446.t1